MKMRSIILAAALAVCCTSVQAQEVGASQQKDRSHRGDLVYDIVLKWAPHVQEVFHIRPASWSRSMATTFANVDIKRLEKAALATDFNVMSAVLLGKSNGKSNRQSIGVDPQALGDAAIDLVYIPVTPCRIMDTRVAGGVIAANTTRGVDVTAVSSYSFQGGENTDCGIGAAGSFAAVVANFTVVTPNAAGYITAFPYLVTQPTAATVNYVAGDIKGNTAIVKLDQGASANEMSVYSFAQTHLVIDVIGYFTNPAATALQCQDTTNVIVSVAAGGTANAIASSCAAGYTQTATNCETGSWDMPIVYQHNGTCSAKNNGGGAAELRASRTCCRVPGR